METFLPFFCPLMHFVDNDVGDSLQGGVSFQPPQQHACGAV